MATQGRLFPPFTPPPSAGLAHHTHEETSAAGDRSYAVYPPVVVENAILGYLRDVNDCAYSRDVGRSSIMNGRVFFQFGDTFCKDPKGDFVGITSHTCSRLCLLEHPEKSEYTRISPLGMVESFIPLTQAEKTFEENNAGRMTLWSFGGMAEDAPKAGRGWCWFEKGECYDDGRTVPLGTGVARVIYDATDGSVYAHRPSDNVLFTIDEPRWGTFSTLEKDGQIYLWGHHKNEVHLARVRPLSVLNKSAYQYWDGHSYVSDASCSIAVFKDFQHGAIYRSDMFAPELGLKYIFVGVNSYADSKINMGCSRSLEGPYEMFQIADATGIDQDGYMYCIYPHPWAFKEQDGELMVTWSEHWPGGVVAAKLKFQQGTQRICSKKVFINDYPHAISTRLGTAPEVKAIQRCTNTRIVPAGCFVMEGMAPSPELGSPLHLLITGESCEKVEEAALLAVRVAERAVREWQEAREEERRRLTQEEGDLVDWAKRSQSRGRRLSNSIRTFFSRRRRSSTAVD